MHPTTDAKTIYIPPINMIIAISVADIVFAYTVLLSINAKSYFKKTSLNRLSGEIRLIIIDGVSKKAIYAVMAAFERMEKIKKCPMHVIARHNHNCIEKTLITLNMYSTVNELPKPVNIVAINDERSTYTRNKSMQVMHDSISFEM
jgi:hypothetical protein